METKERPYSYPPTTINGCDVNLNGNNNGSIQNRLDESLINPTQTISLMTTVPQNIASRNLGDKHTPTRNSLRHSRMIVMYRNGRIPKQYLPFVIKHYRLVKSTKVLTIIIGILMCLVSVWMVLWTPTMDIWNFPYWSAIPVFASGVIGCSFLGFCPRPYPDKPLRCDYHVTKYITIVITSMSIIASVAVLLTCTVHLIYLHTANCQPQSNLNTTCICSIDNSTSSYWWYYQDTYYHYQDFSCQEIDCFLRGILATTCVLNILAIGLESLYLVAQWKSTKKYIYTRVPQRSLERILDR